MNIVRKPSSHILEAYLKLLTAVNTRVARAAISVCLALAIASQLVLAMTIQPVQARANLDNGLALTPYMGWNTYYGLGSNFNEQTIVSVADAMVSRGLEAAGYQYVWLDGGWWSGTRDNNGNITVNATQWPHGMQWIADYIHSKGLKAGIYTDTGSNGCGGANQGSYGHYQQDVNQFAAWGYDAVKVDFCGGHSLGLDPATAYGQFRDALLNNSSHRPMLFNICNPFPPNAFGPNDPPLEKSAYYSYTFGPTTGNSWRTDTDIGFVHSVLWSDMLRNLDHDAAHPEAAGPGHWNDPDYLGPELGMTGAEAQAQFTMWSMVAAPLIIGNDIRSMSAATQAMLTNPEVIAVDQDSLGLQGTRIAQEGNGDVWVKPLANGDRAVALLNRGTSPLTITTSTDALGLAHASSYTLNDLWAHQSTETAGQIKATVAPHSAVLYRVSGGAGNDIPPATILSAPNVPPAYAGSNLSLAIPGQGMTASSTFENDGREPAIGVQLALSAPQGWQVQSMSVGSGTVPTGGQLNGTWLVTPPAGTLPGSYILTATATYHWGGYHDDSRSSQIAVIVPSAPPAGTSYLSDHYWLDASSGYSVPLPDASVGGYPITLQGQKYPKGIGVVPQSDVEYYLGNNCTHLSATVGIDDIVNQISPQGGTAIFQVYADGQKIYDSGLVTRSATASVEVDLTGAKVLTLHVDDAGDGNYNDRADWAGLQLTCGAPVATVPNGPWPHFVPQSTLSATATSAHPGYPASAAVDGKLTTIWHTEFAPPAPLPQSITIDLGSVHNVAGLTYQPRLDTSPNGTITDYIVYVSVGGSTFTKVMSGSWPSDRSLKSVTFSPQQVRYIRLEAIGGVGGYASAAEIDVADLPAS
jgi:alpha-galactosidase